METKERTTDRLKVKKTEIKEMTIDTMKIGKIPLSPLKKRSQSKKI